MSIEKTKDITIDGREFRIGLLPAAVGNWIITQLQAKTFAKEDTFASIQAHCFSVCFWYKVVEATGEKLAMPVFSKPLNKWLLPDLADDIFTANRLYDAVIDFNLSPFFAKLEALDSPPAGTDTLQLPSQTV